MLRTSYITSPSWQVLVQPCPVWVWLEGFIFIRGQSWWGSLLNNVQYTISGNKRGENLVPFPYGNRVVPPESQSNPALSPLLYAYQNRGSMQKDYGIFEIIRFASVCVCECVCVCMWCACLVCVYVCMSPWVCQCVLVVYMCLCVHAYASLMYVSVCVCVCMPIHACMLCKCVCICVCSAMSVCMSVCVRISVYG